MELKEDRVGCSLEELRSIMALQFLVGRETDAARIIMELKFLSALSLFLHLQTPHSAILLNDVLGSSHQSLRDLTTRSRMKEYLPERCHSIIYSRQY